MHLQDVIERIGKAQAAANMGNTHLSSSLLGGLLSDLERAGHVWGASNSGGGPEELKAQIAANDKLVAQLGVSRANAAAAVAECLQLRKDLDSLKGDWDWLYEDRNGMADNYYRICAARDRLRDERDELRQDLDKERGKRLDLLDALSLPRDRALSITIDLGEAPDLLERD